MRNSRICLAVVLTFYCNVPTCLAQATQTAQTTQTTPTPWASRSVALSALESNNETHPASFDQKTSPEGIVVYRVVVNSDGSVLRRDKINGDPDLQILAEPFASSWHFKKVSISGSPSSWWSYVGVCFFTSVGNMVPCSLSEHETSDKAADSLPAQLFLVGNARGVQYEFPPLHKTKGALLERPELARRASITGEVTLDLVITPDGLVSEAKPVMGHPLLLNAAVEAVRGWRFEPVTFLGKPVEVHLRFKVQYGLND